MSFPDINTRKYLWVNRYKEKLSPTDVRPQLKEKKIPRHEYAVVDWNDSMGDVVDRNYKRLKESPP